MGLGRCDRCCRVCPSLVATTGQPERSPQLAVCGWHCLSPTLLLLLLLLPLLLLPLLLTCAAASFVSMSRSRWRSPGRLNSSAGVRPRRRILVQKFVPSMERSRAVTTGRPVGRGGVRGRANGRPLCCCDVLAARWLRCLLPLHAAWAARMPREIAGSNSNAATSIVGQTWAPRSQADHSR